MNILNGNEAFSALMAGKKILCRAVGELVDFDDLDQFPATIFAMPGYEFSIKIDSIELAGITFLKPFSLDELVDGQEVCIVENFNQVTLTQFYSSNTQLVENVKAGFAQRDRENASKQLEAIQKVLGFENTIYLQKGYAVEKDSEQPVEPKKRQSRKKTTDTSVTIADVEPSGVESEDTPWEVDTTPKPKTKHAFTVDEVEAIEEDPLKIVEKFTAQINACTTTKAVLLLRPVFFANGHLEREHTQQLCKLTEEKLLELDPEQYAPKIEIISQENVTTSEDSLINETVEQGEPAPEHQEHLDAILGAVANAQTPIEVNAQIRYTKSWNEEQRKPVIQAMNKRLIELNEQKEKAVTEPPSLMVQIQNTQNERELNELLPEIRSRHVDIQPKLMDLVKKRRFELVNQGSQVAS
ncbi:hypothetical protein FW754_02640 [Acinetobacter sp. 1207_04]|uniref:hypothetical protein n=1 Tax=Acinetobacter sp. 1207_04 TaxID=2604449 RepID=UPI00405885DB